MKEGRFISIEGMDGSGKTTQLRLLEQWFKEQGIDYVFTREPGGTDVGVQIRKLLLEGKSDIDPLSEAMLFFTDRRLHVEQVIKPALAEGKFVVSDRFADSTYAFQKAAGGITYEVFKDLYDLSIGDFKPEFTVYFDIDAETGLKRSVNNTDWDNTETRMEAKGIQYHNAVRGGYLELAEKEPDRIKIINKNKTAEMAEKDFEGQDLSIPHVREEMIKHDIELTFEMLKNYIQEVI